MLERFTHSSRENENTNFAVFLSENRVKPGNTFTKILERIFYDVPVENVLAVVKLSRI